VTLAVGEPVSNRARKATPFTSTRPIGRVPGSSSTVETAASAGQSAGTAPLQSAGANSLIAP
jgi:hypothetical protein